MWSVLNAIQYENFPIEKFHDVDKIIATTVTAIHLHLKHKFCANILFWVFAIVRLTFFFVCIIVECWNGRKICAFLFICRFILIFCLILRHFRWNLQFNFALHIEFDDDIISISYVVLPLQLLTCHSFLLSQLSYSTSNSCFELHWVAFRQIYQWNTFWTQY